MVVFWFPLSASRYLSLSCSRECCRNRNRMAGGSYRAEAMECWVEGFRMNATGSADMSDEGRSGKYYGGDGWVWRGLNVPLELMDARKWRYQWEQEQIEEVGHMKGSDWNKKLFAFLACELQGSCSLNVFHFQCFRVAQCFRVSALSVCLACNWIGNIFFTFT